MNYSIRTVKKALTETTEDESIYSPHGFVAEIENEGAGDFVAVSFNVYPDDKLYIEPNQWPALRTLIDEMIKECK